MERFRARCRRHSCSAAVLLGFAFAWPALAVAVPPLERPKPGHFGSLLRKDPSQDISAGTVTLQAALRVLFLQREFT